MWFVNAFVSITDTPTLLDTKLPVWHADQQRRGTCEAFYTVLVGGGALQSPLVRVGFCKLHSIIDEPTLYRTVMLYCKNTNTAWLQLRFDTIRLLLEFGTIFTQSKVVAFKILILMSLLFW